jgi:predicted extracellular nuclease
MWGFFTLGFFSCQSTEKSYKSIVGLIGKVHSARKDRAVQGAWYIIYRLMSQEDFNMLFSRKTLQVLVALVFVVSLLLTGPSLIGVQADTLAQSLPYHQAWTDINMIKNVQNDWSGVPGVVGYLSGFSATSDLDPRTIVAPVPVGTAYGLNPSKTDPFLEINQYGPTEFELTNPTIAMRGSSAANQGAPNIVISLNTATNPLTGLSLYYKLRDIDPTGSDAVEQVAVQYRVGDTGDFTNLAYTADATTGPYAATQVTNVMVALPAAVENQPLVQLRFITTNASGTDEWVGIDDIAVDKTTSMRPFVSTVTPADGSNNVVAASDINLTFTGTTVTTTGSWYSLKCGDPAASPDTYTAVAAAASGTGVNRTINPNADLTAGNACILTVIGANVTNAGGAMWDNFTSKFIVGSCGSAFTPIHTIQGSTDISPIATQLVTVEGNVSVLPSDLNGYFIQATAAEEDVDPLTSEGLFVYTGPTGSSGLVVGDRVRLNGEVREYTSSNPGEMANVTTLYNVTSRVKCSSGTAPTAKEVTLPTDLEKYEDMLVHFAGNLTVEQNAFQAMFGQLTLGSGGRIFQANNGTGGSATDYLRTVVLDDNSVKVYPNTIPYYASDGILRAGDQTNTAGVTGVIDQGRINASTSDTAYPGIYYRLQPTTAPVWAAAVNPRPAAPTSTGAIKVASFNVDNYFKTLMMLGAKDDIELGYQTTNLVQALKDLNADVIALEEIEADNTANAVQYLVDALNTNIGSATYAVVPDPASGTGPGATQVALIYKTALLSLSGASQSKADAAFNSYPVAQTFTVKANNEKFVVVGAYFNPSQTDQAAKLLEFVNTLKLADPDVIVAGDLNSYAAETPVTALVSGGLTNQAAVIPAASRYSFVADSAAGYLDYILTTASLGRQFKDAKFWHINADEPAVLDYKTAKENTPPVWLHNPRIYRSSDHDPILAGFTFAPNHVPTASLAIPDTTAVEDSPFSYTVPAGTFTEPDTGDSIVGYGAVLAGGNPLPAWLTFNSATQTFSGTPANDAVGQITVEVRAFDTSYVPGATPLVYGFDQFVITVTNTNDAPTVANPIPDQNATEAAAFNFAFAANTFNDIDVGDSLTYSATKADGSPLPTWLTFTPSTRTFSGTPNNSDVGFFTVKVTAKDTSLAAVSTQFVITVIDVNDAPTLANPIDDQDATQGVEFSLTFAANTFNDIDIGDTLTYTATMQDGSPLPTWLTFTSATRTFLGTPANADVATFTVKLTAKDSANATATDEFVVTVHNVNDPPTVANPILDKGVSVNRPFSFAFASNTFADLDIVYGDVLTYTATLSDGNPLPAWLSFNAATRTFSGTSTTIGTIDVKVTATDTSLASVFDVFTLTTRENNPPILAHPLPAEQNATQDVDFTYTFPADTFSDPDVGDSLTYTATKGDGSPLPTWLTFTSATRTFSGTPANADVGMISVLVTATDLSSGTASAPFNLIVANTNDAPTVANPIPSQIARYDVSYTFAFAANTFYDMDLGDTLTYAATLSNGDPLPVWLTFTPATRTFSGMPAESDMGTIIVKVTATDTGSLSVYTTFNLDVKQSLPKLYLPFVGR